MKERKKEAFIPLILLTVISWVLMIAFVTLVEPATVKNVVVNGGYFPFFVLLFGTIFFSCTLLFKNWRQGLMLAVGVTLLLVLRLIKLANVVNISLLVIFLGILDAYFSNR